MSLAITNATFGIPNEGEEAGMNLKVVNKEMAVEQVPQNVLRGFFARRVENEASVNFGGGCFDIERV
jgi:hypothetical protein